MLFLRALSQGPLVISLHESVEKRVKKIEDDTFLEGKEGVFTK